MNITAKVLRTEADECVFNLQTEVRRLDAPINKAREIGKLDLAVHLTALQVQILSAIRLYWGEVESLVLKGGHE